MRRQMIIVLLLALALTMPAFAACSSGTENAAGETEKTTADAQAGAAEADAEPISLLGLREDLVALVQLPEDAGVRALSRIELDVVVLHVHRDRIGHRGRGQREHERQCDDGGKQFFHSDSPFVFMQRGLT